MQDHTTSQLEAIILSGPRCEGFFLSLCLDGTNDMQDLEVIVQIYYADVGGVNGLLESIFIEFSLNFQ